MKKFEYFSQVTPDEFTQAQLQWYGEHGWELICIDNNTWYFKREVPEKGAAND